MYSKYNLNLTGFLSMHLNCNLKSYMRDGE